MKTRKVTRDDVSKGKAVDGMAARPPRSRIVTGVYVPYPKAMDQLAHRLGATHEEMAAWIWMGPELGGLAAYLNANEFDHPPRFSFPTAEGSRPSFDFVSPLMQCWLRADEVARFDPAERFITGRGLIERWSGRLDLLPEGFVLAKIAESRLSDLHPLSGTTRGTWTEEDKDYFPPLSSALFRLSEVKQIEREDFPGDEQGKASASSVRVEKPRAIRDASNTCAVFVAMQGLKANEVCIAFVGTKGETGLAANNLLEVSARRESRRVALAALDLADRRTGGLNSQAAILLGMAEGRKLTYTSTVAKRVDRLRAALRLHLGLVDDPFFKHTKGDGWRPRFEVLDKRGLADKRAKREGEHRTASYERLVGRGGQFEAGQSEAPFDDEDDAAGDFLRSKDRGRPA